MRTIMLVRVKKGYIILMIGYDSGLRGIQEAWMVYRLYNIPMISPNKWVLVQSYNTKFHSKHFKFINI